jgi:hypothetical protein
VVFTELAISSPDGGAGTIVRCKIVINYEVSTITVQWQKFHQKSSINVNSHSPALARRP